MATLAIVSSGVLLLIGSVTVSHWELLGAVVVLLFGSAFYSGIETAFLSARRGRIEHRAEEGHHDGQIATDLMQDPAKTIAVTLVGTNLCNIAATSLATSVARDLWVENGPAIATLVLTPIALFGAEILPKAFFRTRATRLLLRFSTTLRFSRAVFAPFVEVATFATKLLLRVLPIPSEEKAPVFRREDLENIFLFGRIGSQEEDAAGGKAGDAALRMAGRALDLSNRKVHEALVPVRPGQTCRGTETVREGRARFRTCGTQYLAIVDSRDRVQGFVSAKRLLGEPDEKELSRLLRPAAVLAPDDSLEDALRRFRGHGQPIALIRGRHGETLGIVTPEDVLEEIVGELGASRRDDGSASS